VIFTKRLLFANFVFKALKALLAKQTQTLIYFYFECYGYVPKELKA